MGAYVLDFEEIDRSKVALVGGKGANLGELCRIGGVHVPDGFCVTTEAYERVIGSQPSIKALLDRLSRLHAEDRDEIAERSAEIRTAIEATPIPAGIREEITRHLNRLGIDNAYAVRSSATAEDLPRASFAGQQDTYLNVSGVKHIHGHIRLCWASLFSERAVTYRIQNGFDHRSVRQAVVVQKMVFPQAAGILFTADPVTFNRKVSTIDAGYGLGEAVVSGLVTPDTYKVRDGQVVDKQVAAKELAVTAADDGGTTVREIEPERQNLPVLSDEQIVRLAQLGRKIELQFGCPQDIEWCLDGDEFAIVQSRPITTLYPIPAVDDGENHLYISVGHQQMMTDAIRLLGISVFQMVALRPMFAAGGRLFVDVANDLASPQMRNVLLRVMGPSEPLIGDALRTVLERGDFIKPLPEDEGEQLARAGGQVPLSDTFQSPTEDDPAIVSDLIQRSQMSIEEARQAIATKTGTDLFDFIEEDIQRLKQELRDLQSSNAIRAGMGAASWINENMERWLGEKNVADTLTLSAPNNVTSEMGLALMDVADEIRPNAQVVDYLRTVEDDDFLDDLPTIEGGQESQDAIRAFLQRYGMRCAGEIDITRPRWRERPATLIPMILNNVDNFAPNAGQHRFEQGQREAARKEEELLGRLRQLPDGEQQAAETKRVISLLRHFIGYREYPKYSMMSRFFLYRQALLREAEALVEAGVVREPEDVYYLTFEEFRDAVRTHAVDAQLISNRKAEYARFERLTPPRVLTSDGEIVTGAYRRENLPDGALAGLAVSSGVVEGRAHVVLDMQDAYVQPGDILVTTFTDPSWTALFASIAGLVTEVGGLMTHGAVIAREYGLPAVVGVVDATKLIADGQRIRVNGTEGTVEILNGGAFSVQEAIPSSVQ